MNQPLIQSDTVLLITREGLGSADLPLQHKLINIYLDLLIETNLLPAVICFYTEGVKLVVEGSPVLSQLKALEDKGVRLILCQTCLNYFQILDKVQVGIVGGMTDILEAQWKAEKVITL
jgi:hypothetical protein